LGSLDFKLQEKNLMRIRPAALCAPALVFAALLANPIFAQAATQSISCSQISDAQHFVDGLHPGPNTSAAQQHLDAAKQASDAGDQKRCVSELSRVDYYARRSAAADKRGATGHHRRVQCADALHQNRPGGTDYHGPAVAGCPRPAI
jgi:hypothetical protein